MQALKSSSVLTVLVALVSLCCQAQSNVYSVAIYSAGNSWADLCLLALPFPPYRYRLTLRSWYEDAHGLTIMDVRNDNEKAKGGILKRSLEVEYGSNSFSMPLNPIPPKTFRSDASLPGTNGSGDLARLVVQCAASRGGHVTANTIPVIQASWVRQSQEILDIFVVDGDHFVEVEKFLEHTYGAPDTTIHSSSPVGNGRSLTYTPQQIGVVLNLTADSRQTIVSVIGRQKS